MLRANCSPPQHQQQLSQFQDLNASPQVKIYREVSRGSWPKRPSVAPASFQTLGGTVGIRTNDLAVVSVALYCMSHPGLLPALFLLVIFDKKPTKQPFLFSQHFRRGNQIARCPPPKKTRLFQVMLNFDNCPFANFLFLCEMRPFFRTIPFQNLS